MKVSAVLFLLCSSLSCMADATRGNLQSLLMYARGGGILQERDSLQVSPSNESARGDATTWQMTSGGASAGGVDCQETKKPEWLKWPVNTRLDNGCMLQTKDVSSVTGGADMLFCIIEGTDDGGISAYFTKEGKAAGNFFICPAGEKLNIPKTFTHLLCCPEGVKVFGD
mmetsp:Transcript_84817/g.146561  ORF Transcript_84817/g.146561 Transcript_84817/m.146561 type:complete len:169 (+) Transcript_84817:112-618(+)